MIGQSKQVQWLYANDRGFPERTHAHTALFKNPWTVYRDADFVPLELAHDHRYDGLVTVAIDTTPDSKDLTSFLEKEAIPELLAGSSIAGCSSWIPIDRGSSDDQAPMDLGTPSGGDERVMQLFFLDKEPKADWDRFVKYAEQIDASGKGKVVFAAPFLPTDVGTDKYTDQLF